MQIHDSKDEVIEEPKKEKKPIQEQKLSFCQRHKLAIVLSIIVILVVTIGFIVGFQVEKKVPKNQKSLVLSVQDQVNKT